MFAMLLLKVTLVSFLWMIVSVLYMAWIGAPVSNKNDAVVFGPTVFMFVVIVIYGIVVL